MAISYATSAHTVDFVQNLANFICRKRSNSSAATHSKSQRPTASKKLVTSTHQQQQHTINDSACLPVSADAIKGASNTTTNNQRPTSDTAAAQQQQMYITYSPLVLLYLWMLVHVPVVVVFAMCFWYIAIALCLCVTIGITGITGNAVIDVVKTPPPHGMQPHVVCVRSCNFMYVCVGTLVVFNVHTHTHNSIARWHVRYEKAAKSVTIKEL